MGLVLSVLTIYDITKYAIDRTVTTPDGIVTYYHGSPYMAGASVLAVCALYGLYCKSESLQLVSQNQNQNQNQN